VRISVGRQSGIEIEIVRGLKTSWKSAQCRMRSCSSVGKRLKYWSNIFGGDARMSVVDLRVC